MVINYWLQHSLDLGQDSPGQATSFKRRVKHCSTRAMIFLACAH